MTSHTDHDRATERSGAAGCAGGASPKTTSDFRASEPLSLLSRFPPGCRNGKRVAALLAFSPISCVRAVVHHHAALPAARRFLALRVAAARPLAKMTK